MSQTLPLSLSTFINTVYSRNLADFRRIPSLVQIWSTGQHDDVLVDQLSFLFQLRLIRYLTGQGHPDHPAVKSFLSSSSYSNKSEVNAILRPRMFLLAMTDSDIVPIDINWRLTVSYLHPLTNFSTPTRLLNQVRLYMPESAPFSVLAQTASHQVRPHRIEDDMTI